MFSGPGPKARNPKFSAGLGDLRRSLWRSQGPLTDCFRVKGLGSLEGFIVNPRKLEHGFRTISARIPYTLP